MRQIVRAFALILLVGVLTSCQTVSFPTRASVESVGSCNWLGGKLAPLHRSEKGNFGWKYTQSLDGSVDNYTTAWNWQTLGLAGITDDQAKQFGKDMLARAVNLESPKGSPMPWDIALTLAIRLRSELNKGTVPLDVLQEVEHFDQRFATNGNLTDPIIREIALTLLNYRAPLDPILVKRIRSMNLRYSEHASIIDNLESYIFLKAIQKSPIQAGYPADFVNQTLESTLNETASGLGLAILYQVNSTNSTLVEKRQPSLKKYLAKLTLDGGGFSAFNNEVYDPQATFYASAISGINRNLFVSPNFNEMKLGFKWLPEMGHMPIGTQVLATALLHFCSTNQLNFMATVNSIHTSTSVDQLFACYSKYVGNAKRDEFAAYLSDSALGKSRRLTLSRICLGRVLENQKPVDVAQRIGQDSILNAFAYSLLDSSEPFGAVDSRGESFKVASACRFVNQNGFPTPDLMSTALCATNNILSTSEIEKSKAMFRAGSAILTYPGQSTQEATSIEAVLWYFMLVNAKTLEAPYLLGVQ